MPDRNLAILNSKKIGLFMNKILSILIPTVYGREQKFEALYSFIQNQIESNNLQDKVEIIFLKDNKEMSIGEKRNELYRLSKGKYSVQIDDDDWLADNYLVKVLNACNYDFDCIGYQEWHTENGVKGVKSDLSLAYNSWMSYSQPIRGFSHVRTPFFKNPIKTQICQTFSVDNSRFGEDHSWAIKIKPFLKTESYIDEIMYYHRYVFENHNIKYGIK